MADQLNFMLDQMDEKFDLTFDSKSQKEQTSSESSLKPSNNPQRHSPQNSTAQEQVQAQPEGQSKQVALEETHQKISVDESSQNGTDFIDICANKEQQEVPMPEHVASPLQNESFQLHIQGKRTLSPDRPINFDDQEYEHEHQEQEELMSYRSLSEKLENALSRLRKTTVPIDSEFSVRQEQFIRRKKSDLDLLRAQQQRQESLRYTGKPLLNSKSMQILTNHYKPIQTRYKDVLKEKKKKLQISMTQKKNKQKQEEEKVIRDMKQKQKEIKNKLGEIRTEQEYYDWMQDWSEVRDKKVEEMAFKQGQSALSKTTFKPNINPRSEVLMKKKPNRVPVYEQEPNVKKGGVDKNCTFRPNLTKTLKK